MPDKRFYGYGCETSSAGYSSDDCKNNHKHECDDFCRRCDSFKRHCKCNKSCRKCEKNRLKKSKSENEIETKEKVDTKNGQCIVIKIN